VRDLFARTTFPDELIALPPTEYNGMQLRKLWLPKFLSLTKVQSMIFLKFDKTGNERMNDDRVSHS
jgi:hypothetical protein